MCHIYADITARLVCVIEIKIGLGNIWKYGSKTIRTDQKAVFPYYESILNAY